MNFGYLPKTDIETGNLRSESQLIDAIKRLQVFSSWKLIDNLIVNREESINLISPLSSTPTDNRQHSSDGSDRREHQAADE